MLIKQAHWPEEYGYIIHNIEQMRAMHENKYDNVYYIDPKESIMTALKLCDMVVSDESSVMVEALMFHKPSIAVTDWLIPDTKPARRAVMPIDCFIKCKKVELREYAEKLVSDPSYYHSVLEKGGQFFLTRDLSVQISWMPLNTLLLAKSRLSSKGIQREKQVATFSAKNLLQNMQPVLYGIDESIVSPITHQST